MTPRRLRFRLRELMAATLLAGLVMGAFAARARHPGRPDDQQWMLLGAVAVAVQMGCWRLRTLLHRIRLRELARRHAPPPQPSRFRPPDCTDLLASRLYARTPSPRPIVRHRS